MAIRPLDNLAWCAQSVVADLRPSVWGNAYLHSVVSLLWQLLIYYACAHVAGWVGPDTAGKDAAEARDISKLYDAHVHSGVHMKWRHQPVAVGRFAVRRSSASEALPDSTPPDQTKPGGGGNSQKILR